MHRAAVGPTEVQRPSLHIDLEAAKKAALTALDYLIQLHPNNEEIPLVRERLAEEDGDSFLDFFEVEGDTYSAWYAPNGDE